MCCFSKILIFQTHIGEKGYGIFITGYVTIIKVPYL